MTLSYISIFAAILLPVLPGNWGYFLGAVAGSVGLLILSFYLCDDAPAGYQNPWHALGCLITVIAAGFVALGSIGLGAYRIAGRARGWGSARFPGILLPGLVFYLGAAGLLWLLFMVLRY